MFAKRDRYRTGEHALNKKEYQKLISVVDHLEDEVMIKLASPMLVEYRKLLIKQSKISESE